jgi:hypothetical protein
MEGKEGTMPDSPGADLSVAALFAERDARRRRDREAEEQLQRRKEEEIAEYRKRLDNFQLTDAVIKSGLNRIKRAFERGETELMMASFPGGFCTDGGRAIINAGAPPINEMSKEELARRADEHEWLGTLPAGARLFTGTGRTICGPAASSPKPASLTTPVACQEMSGCSLRGRRAVWKADPVFASGEAQNDRYKEGQECSGGR